MQIRLIPALSILLVGAPAFAKVLGFDPPKKVVKRKLGLSTLVKPRQRIEETCWAYEGSAIVWREDPGEKGITSIELREGAEPCDAKYKGASRKITLEAGWPLGRAGRFLVVQDEPLGNLAMLGFFDLDTGKRVLEISRDTEADLAIERRGAAIGARMLAALKLSCVPDKVACWEQVRRENAIPSTVALEAPDCSSAFAKEPATRSEPRGLAVTAPVEVADLATPKLVFTSGTARCAALP